MLGSHKLPSGARPSYSGDTKAYFLYLVVVSMYELSNCRILARIDRPEVSLLNNHLSQR